MVSAVRQSVPVSLSTGMVGSCDEPGPYYRDETPGTKCACTRSSRSAYTRQSSAADYKPRSSYASSTPSCSPFHHRIFSC